MPNKLYPVPKKENENAADPRSIVNFVDWCVNTVEVEDDGEISFGRRADKYALIFSGHSLGFQDIGLFKDETSGKSMKMIDFFRVLARIHEIRNGYERSLRNVVLRVTARKIETKICLVKRSTFWVLIAA